MKLLILAHDVAVPRLADALVSTRLIRPDDVLRAADVALQRGDMEGVASDPAQVVGLEAQVAIYPGRPVRLADLGPAAVIERNETVVMVYRQGSLTIQSEGRALGRAALGDSVTVMNTASRQSVQARVTSFGQVEVGRVNPISQSPPAVKDTECAKSSYACAVGPSWLASHCRRLAAPRISPRRRTVQNTPPCTACPCRMTSAAAAPGDSASLWSAGQMSLLGDRRASSPGDILTVVIEIDDSAQISNSTARGRNGSTSMGGPSLFGIPEAIDRRLSGGVSIAEGFSTEGATDFSGNGNVSRNEQLTLRVASTVVERLPNDILHIEGRQEVRVNHELRELLVTGLCPLRRYLAHERDRL